MKIPSNLIGKYGPQYTDMGSLDDGSFNFKSSLSAKHLAPEKNSATSDNSTLDELIDGNEIVSKENRSKFEESDISGNGFSRGEDLKTAGSNAVFDQMEDAITKAKFLAAQQFLLQNFQKQRELLMAATSTQNPSTSSDEG